MGGDCIVKTYSPGQGKAWSLDECTTVCRENMGCKQKNAKGNSFGDHFVEVDRDQCIEKCNGQFSKLYPPRKPPKEEKATSWFPSFRSEELDKVPLLIRPKAPAVKGNDGDGTGKKAVSSPN